MNSLSKFSAISIGLALAFFTAALVTAADISGFRGASSSTSTNLTITTNGSPSVVIDSGALAVRIVNLSGVGLLTVSTTPNPTVSNGWTVISANGGSFTFGGSDIIPQMPLYFKIDGNSNGLSTNSVNVITLEK